MSATSAPGTGIADGNDSAPPPKFDIGVSGGRRAQAPVRSLPPYG